MSARLSATTFAAICAVALLAGSVAAAPAPAPNAASPEPLLAWTDDPPATEVRPLSGARTVALRYGATLDPKTFYATLDGEPVTPEFKPEAGKAETVTLTFIGGRNHLVLTATSADGLTHATLERWITFARMPGDENATERVPSAPELKHELWKRKNPPAAEPAAAPGTKP